MPIATPCSRHRSLRIAGATSAVVAAISLLVGPLIITIIDPYLCRIIISRSRSCRGFDIGSLLLLCHIVVVGVVRNIILLSPSGPWMSRLRSLKSFLTSSSSREVSIMNEEGSSIGIFPGVLPCSNTSEHGRRNETTDGDPGGGGDSDGTGGGVSTSLVKGLPTAEGERSRLVPLLSSIGG
jgi:hypothetical protein